MGQRSLLFSLVGCIFISGCGDGGAAVLKRRSNLERVGAAYLEFFESHGKSPVVMTELTSHMQTGADGDTAVTDAVTALEEGDIVVNFNGVLGERAENAGYVLAFEASAPGSGGYVVMGDGAVKLMTGKDFSEATMLPQNP